jgi:signal transduction histidine kinase
LAIIGRELIRDETVAISELAKNSYDADSTHVEIRLLDILNPKLAKIEIKDDGHGMTSDVLRKAWLEPATSIKKTEQKGRSPEGRVLLGEKGVGRFAVDKLGQMCEIVSRAKNEDYETVLYLNTEAYDRDVYLDEIENRWEIRSPKEIIDPPQGTVIRITKLRGTYTRDLTERIHKALAKLVLPTAKLEFPFEIRLICPDFPELTGRVQIPLPLVRAPYSVSGTVNEDGRFTYVIKNGPLMDEDLTSLDRETSKWFQKRKPECGPFKITIYVWEKSPAELKKAGVDAEGNKYLRENFGIRVYRDGFRVLPYGDFDDDWLDLDGRRVQNPTLRIGRNRILGWVEISRQSNPKLVDKTNREGIIEEGRAFEDLRILCVAALSLLERYRYPIRPDARKKGRGSNVYVTLYQLKTELRSHPAGKLVTVVEREYSDEIKEWEEQFERMADLAGIGVTLEKITHEFDKTVIVAKENQTSLLEHLEGAQIDKSYSSRLVKNTVQVLAIAETQLELMSPLYFPQRGKLEDVSIREVAESVFLMFSERARELGVAWQIVPEKDDIVVRANRGKLIQVFVNLVDNALYWLETARSVNPRVEVRINRSERHVIVADNGPGVSRKDLTNLFQPFFSTKPRGRGLGLYICKDILGEIQGEIVYLGTHRVLDGANFMISLPK